MKQRKIVLPLIATIALTAAGYLGIKSFNHDDDAYSSLVMQNIEALTQGESIVNCDNGCSTNNTNTYCCTLWGYKLYKYR